MTLIKESLWRGRLLVLILPALLAGGLMFTGCSNDPVAPHDEAPDLTTEDVATQAGLVAKAISLVGPQVIDFAGKSDKNSYSYSFPASENVTGEIHMDYFLGGPGGTSVAWDVGDYVDLYTATGEQLDVAVDFGGGLVLAFSLTFDIGAVLDRPNNKATISGTGTFASGTSTATFSFTDLVVVKAGDYPASGGMSFTGAGFSMTVTFDGTNMAILAISDGSAYDVDLDTGQISPIPSR